jgi:anti-sigma regulatory factor (Ser/Thr protein kinase)
VSGGPGAYCLRIPASADRSATARSFVAAAARQAGADERVVDDLRLAVTEACTLALRTARAPTTLTLVLRAGAEAIAMSVETASKPDDSSSALSGAKDLEPDEGSGRGLLDAIASELQMVSDDDGQITISFVVPFPPAPEPPPDAAVDAIAVPGTGHGDLPAPS